MSHEELQELAGSYALGALDGPDFEAFHEHLGACPGCRARVQEFEEAYAEGLGDLDPVPASPDLKQRILSNALAGILPTPDPEPAPASSGWSPALRTWGLALLWVFAIGVGVLGWLEAERQSERATTAEEKLDLAQTELLARRVEVEAVRGEARTLRRNRDWAETWLRLLTPLQSASWDLTSDGDAVARVVLHNGLLGVLGEDWPIPADERVYVLWVLTEAGPERVGAVTRGAGGRVMERFAAPAVIEGFAVSVEQDAEASAPAGPIVLQGS